MDAALIVAFTLRAVGVLLLCGAALMLSWAWIKGRLQETLGYAVLRLGRRSGLTTALLLIVIFFALTGLVSANTDLGAIPVNIAQAVGGVTFLAASLAAFALTWLGLSVSGPTPDSQLVLDASEPYLASVGAIDRSSSQRPRA